MNTVLAGIGIGGFIGAILAITILGTISYRDHYAMNQYRKQLEEQAAYRNQQLDQAMFLLDKIEHSIDNIDQSLDNKFLLKGGE